MVQTFYRRTRELEADLSLDLCGFKATLGYIRLIQSQREIEPSSGGSHLNSSIWESHNFSHNTRKVEPRRDMAGRERNRRQ